MSQPEILSQEFDLGFTYTRSTGPLVGRFLTELRDRNIVGVKAGDGTVYVPPMEYDPATAEELSEIVELGQAGEVVTWCWVTEPRESHPHDRAFAWAMIKLDGADIPMLHSVCVEREADMKTGMRVRVQWADEPRGHITDIACFVAEDAAPLPASGKRVKSGERETLSRMEAPIYLKYHFTAGEATSRFLGKIKQGKLVGQRCPRCKNVYIPPRGSCAACGVATEEEVEVADKCTLESFTIVHIPIPNNPIQPPYIIANLIPDGANISFIHLLSECVNEEVHIGQRVQAVWKPEAEWTHAMDNIKYFKPIAEPDVPIAMIGKLPITGWEG